MTALRTRGLTKAFGSVIANDHIDFHVDYGEIVALLGENGSGKTTLMNMLAGIYAPDSGEIYIDDKRVNIHSPADAIRLGIGMIHQHDKLVDILTARENILLGSGGAGAASRRLDAEIDDFVARCGIRFNPDLKVYNMSVSERQQVEIFRVLFRGARILILDEPTAVLTPQETEALFSVMRGLKDRCATVFISHKLAEVMEISDRVVMLRQGHFAGDKHTCDANPKSLTNMMVGKAVDLSIERPKVPTADLLSVKNISVNRADGRAMLKNVSLEVKSGEILGVAGVAGSGQKQLCEALAGLMRIESGQVVFDGRDIANDDPREIRKLGVHMSFVPEDRLGMGLVGSMHIVDNLLLKKYTDTPGPMLLRGGARRQAQDIIKRLRIATPSEYFPVRRLSGGNIQKVLVGREILANPRLLITAYPVRGLDIDASHTIYALINEQKRAGVGVLYIGEDLDALLELCDRVMVLCGGEVMGVIDANGATKERIGLMMMGAKEATADA